MRSGKKLDDDEYSFAAEFQTCVGMLLFFAAVLMVLLFGLQRGMPDQPVDVMPYHPDRERCK